MFLETFLLKSGVRQGCCLSPLPFNIILEILATAIRQEKEIKVIRIVREEVKLSLYTNDMMLYFYRLYTETTRSDKFNKVGGFKINTQKSVAFLYTNDIRKQKLKKKPFEIMLKI